jgi:uncharacterized phage-like protein YoqJ
MKMKICFTGHRPEKLICGYYEYHPVCLAIKEKLRELIHDFVYSRDQEHIFITGMAMGTDIWAAEAVLKMQNKHPEKDIKLVCAEPFKDHIKVMLDKDWRKRYREVIAAADKICTLMETYVEEAFTHRDHWMVDHADAVIAVLNHAHKYAEEAKATKKSIISCIRGHSGTAATVRYALQQGKHVLAIDPLAPDEAIHLFVPEI